MNSITNGFLDVAPLIDPPRHAGRRSAGDNVILSDPGTTHAEALRRHAWEIGETRPGDAYAPTTNHVGLASVAPYQGFAYWRIRAEWVEQTARQRGSAWHGCRLVLRLYDVSFIVFNGFNAHRIQDHALPALCGQFYFKLPRPGTWELAEVGFLLQSGEFIPAARSAPVPFPPEGASSRTSRAALLVNDHPGPEEIGNLWDQESILQERRRPRLRRPLRCAALAFASRESGQQGWLATFVSEMATGQCAQGHEMHVFVPATDPLNSYRQVAGVHYHPLEMDLTGNALDQARAFASAVESRLQKFPPFDVIHHHEWMTALGRRPGDQPVILSLSSIEATRRNGAPPSDLSQAIEQAECAAARTAACVLTPDWLRDQAVADLGLDNACVHAFPMEGRLPNEWEMPLDYGHIKMDIGLGPLDRVMLFVGPLEHAAGVDLLLEALPPLLQRAANLRVVLIGEGIMYGQLHHRAYQLGVAHAVRILGHVQGPRLTRLVRAAEALVLPSRCRVAFDDAVVDLARRAGRPVITTHGGPAHLVRHEENGIVTYDNPGSMVWAIDRILGDPAHAERMGNNARRHEGSAVTWSEVARHYLELCAARFPQLTERSW
jgi:glycosyltransferase involved in cell wall biosynthesis